MFGLCVWEVTIRERIMGGVKGHERKENEMEVLQDKACAVLAEPRAWQALAVDEYERALPRRQDALGTELAARVLTLTGHLIPSEDIYAEGRMAVTGVDGATFRLYHGGDLVLVRACAYCGTGRFESPGISDRAGLGYALSAWLPTHEDCEDFASEDLAEW